MDDHSLTEPFFYSADPSDSCGLFGALTYTLLSSSQREGASCKF